MISKIHLHNFQAHPDTVIDLDPGITALIGSSNVGKTSIFRALRWVRENRPRGKAFIRDNETDCWVSIESDEHTIMRQRTKSDDGYVVDGQIHTALSGNVPEQVTDILNLKEINISSQLEPHFLVLDSPGKIASAINQVVHLEDAEAVIDELRSELRRASADAKSIEEQKEAQELILSRYSVLDEYSHTLEAANSVQANLQTNTGIVSELDKLLDEIIKIENEIVVWKIPEGLEACLSEIESLIGILKSKQGVYNELTGLIDAVKSIPDEQDFTEILELLDTIDNGLFAEQLKRKQKRSLRLLVEEISDLDFLIVSGADVIKKLENELADIDFCPTCGQVICKE